MTADAISISAKCDFTRYSQIKAAIATNMLHINDTFNVCIWNLKKRG